MACPFPTVVLSLPGSARRAAAEATLKRLGVAEAEFVDGVEVPADRDAFRARFLADELGLAPPYPPNALSHGSLGCALAFLRLFARLAAKEGPPRSWLVLEDDAVLNPALDPAAVKWSRIDEHTRGFDVAFLHATPVPCGCVAMLVRPSFVSFMASREVARNVMASNLPIDLYIWRHPSIKRFAFQDATRGTGLFHHAGAMNDARTSERLQRNVQHTARPHDHVSSARKGKSGKK